MSKRLLVLLLSVTVGLGLVACGDDDKSSTSGGSAATQSQSASSDTPKKGGTMTVGAASGIPQLNPVLRGTAWEVTLLPLLWNSLTRLDREGKVAPDLATEWEASPDNKTWTFQMRDDVKFSNGKALTSADVVATVDYYLDPKTATQLKTALAPIADVTAEGPTTVVFKLKDASALLPDLVAEVKILDMDSLKTIDKDPAVTGPFKVKEFVPNDHLTLIRNPDYVGDPAPLDELRLVKAADATSAVTSLRSGDLDALWSVPSSDIPQLEKDPALRVVRPKVTGQYVSWEFDMTSPPFDDIRARQAVAYAVDREAILKAAYYDQGQISKTNTPLVENSPWYGGELVEYPYDLDKAKELFQQAGVDSFTWWGVAGQYPEWNTSAQILQESLKKIGVTMKIKNTELGTWPAKFYPAGKKFPGLLVPNFQSFTTNPYWELGFLREGRCECNWNDREFESVFNDAIATADEAERNELWKRAQELINKDVPIIVPVQSEIDTVTKANVVGLWLDGGGSPHFEGAGFAAS